MSEAHGAIGTTTSGESGAPKSYTCKKCGMVYEKPQKRCATCGAKMRAPIKVTRLDVAAIFIALFVTVIATGHTAKVIVAADNLLTSGFYASPIGKNLDSQAIETSLEKMITEYNDNRLLWNQTYLNRRVKFSGVAADIYGDAKYGHIYIGSLMPTYAHFTNSNIKALLPLRVGDSVTIIGTCKGFSKDGSQWNLRFMDCHIVNDGAAS